MAKVPQSDGGVKDANPWIFSHAHGRWLEFFRTVNGQRIGLTISADTAARAPLMEDALEMVWRVAQTDSGIGKVRNDLTMADDFIRLGYGEGHRHGVMLSGSQLAKIRAAIAKAVR